MWLAPPPLLLSLLLASQAAGGGRREKRQICFGGGSCHGGGRPQEVTFPSGPAAVDSAEPAVSLADILGTDISQDSQGGLVRRINFQEEDKDRRLGTACQTPDLQPGTCSNIMDGQCGAVLASIRAGVTRRLVTYLRAAIGRPCGFLGTGVLSLCCSDQASPPTVTVVTG